MELALKRERSKVIPIALLSVCLLLLVPSAVVFANSIASNPAIGFTGVNNPDLTVGMVGISNSERLIDSGNTNHLNPSSAAFQLGALLPLIFIAAALLMLMKILLSDEVELKTIVIAAVLILIALVFLINIQGSVTGLLGG